MANSQVDFRSDTVTTPSPAMRACIKDAAVGDDVYGEDPSVNLLQERIAQLLGKEAALLVPTGTMANQIAIGLHTSPGDEIFCHESYHVNLSEQGAIARLWGASTRTIAAQDGILTVPALEAALRPADCHFPTSRLVCLENTLNRMGGSIYPYDTLQEVTSWAKTHDLKLHLDGARLFNAAIATGISAAQWSKPFDTISVCFSKSLGAPMGSAVVGSKEMIAKAVRLRKVLGGGMRQIGLMAAAADYALQHNIERLAQDHQHAKVIAEAIKKTPGLKLLSDPVATNIVLLAVDESFGTNKAFTTWAKANGFLISSLPPATLRICTHLDISESHVESFASFLKKMSKEKLASFANT